MLIDGRSGVSGSPEVVVVRVGLSVVSEPCGFEQYANFGQHVWILRSGMWDAVPMLGISFVPARLKNNGTRALIIAWFTGRQAGGN